MLALQLIALEPAVTVATAHKQTLPNVRVQSLQSRCEPHLPPPYSMLSPEMRCEAGWRLPQHKQHDANSPDALTLLCRQMSLKNTRKCENTFIRKDSSSNITAGKCIIFPSSFSNRNSLSWKRIEIKLHSHRKAEGLEKLEFQAWHLLGHMLVVMQLHAHVQTLPT